MNYNADVCLAHLFEYLSNTTDVDQDSIKLLSEFFLERTCENDYLHVKRKNHTEQRIFSNDKPNKYKDEVKIKIYAKDALFKVLET